MLCRNIYRKSCNWFMFDSTTNECKLFAGSLNDLKSVCREFGYQREPNYETCDAVFESESANGCYVNRKINLFIFALDLKILNLNFVILDCVHFEHIISCSYFRTFDKDIAVSSLNHSTNWMR